MGFLHMFSHYCESTVKTFGPLRTYYPPLIARPWNTSSPATHTGRHDYIATLNIFVTELPPLPASAAVHGARCSTHFTSTTAFTRASATSRLIQTSFTPVWGPPRVQVVGSSCSSSGSTSSSQGAPVAAVHARGALSTIRAGADGGMVRPLPRGQHAHLCGKLARAAGPPARARGPPFPLTILCTYVITGQCPKTQKRY